MGPEDYMNWEPVVIVVIALCVIGILWVLY